MWEKVKPEVMLVGRNQKACRTISNTVISGRVALPPLSDDENDRWSESISGAGFTQVGGIANFGDAAGLITPAQQRAVDDWLASQNILARRRNPAVALACTGATFHHDAESYTDEVFCVLWLSDDTPWDVYFPFIDKRIPLEYGAIFVFDSAQPHGVVPHGETIFDEDAFEYATGVFASQDLVIGPRIRAQLGIKTYSRKGKSGMHMLNSGLFREEMYPDSGDWHVRYFKNRK